MIDTHCHILPGLDDGAADEAVTLEMARVALSDGVQTIIATPHMREGDYLNERPRVLEAVDKVRALLARERLPLTIVPGSEVHLAPRLAERVEEGRLLTYADGKRYLLLECPYRTRPVRLEETIFDLTVRGVTPVIAHPERIKFFQDEIARYEEVVRLGALGQMTSSSLTGLFGKRIKALSETMVRRGLVHVLGSDAHDPEYRAPVLRAARERWAELDGEESARLATETWPQAILDGAPIDAAPPVEEEEPRGFFGRLFGR